MMSHVNLFQPQFESILFELLDVFEPFAHILFVDQLTSLRDNPTKPQKPFQALVTFKTSLNLFSYKFESFLPT